MQQRNGYSILGYGCMRFTRNGNTIDFDKAEKEFMRAYELGVNYFDTAIPAAKSLSAASSRRTASGTRSALPQSSRSTSSGTEQDSTSISMRS